MMDTAVHNAVTFAKYSGTVNIGEILKAVESPLKIKAEY